MFRVVSISGLGCLGFQVYLALWGFGGLLGRPLGHVIFCFIGFNRIISRNIFSGFYGSS